MTGFDDALLPNAELRLGQELNEFMRGRVTLRCCRVGAWEAAAAFCAALGSVETEAAWVVSRAEFDAMVQKRCVYAKDGAPDDAASGAADLGPIGVAVLADAKEVAGPSVDGNTLPRCRVDGCD